MTKTTNSKYAKNTAHAIAKILNYNTEDMDGMLEYLRIIPYTVDIMADGRHRYSFDSDDSGVYLTETTWEIAE